MYKYKKARKGSIYTQGTKVEGETIEQKVERIVQNKEPIKDGAPEIFTERKEGVLAGYNIRTDRFELATEAMDYVSRSKLAERMARHEEPKVIDMKPNEGGNSESSQQ